MKKLAIIIGIIFIILSIILSFGYKKNININTYYNVYLENKLLGVVNNKKELEKYINKNNNKIKEKYNVDVVYSPSTLNIEKINSYYKKTTSIEKMYKLISSKSFFSINGYKITIKSKNNDKKIRTLYVTQKNIFDEAVVDFIKTYVGEEKYNNYINDNQQEIEETGTYINNVYIDENISIKKMNISINKKIYTDSEELAKILVFDTNQEHKKYIVKQGESLSEIAFNNKVSVEELIISNPEITSKNALLYNGQEIVIGVTNPLLSVVVESYVVEDTQSNYTTEERYDDTKYKGYSEVIQEGKNGVDRVSKNIKSINNYITYVQPVGIKTIENSVNRIILKGKKIAPQIGDLSIWKWPTNNGWMLTDDYGYRIHPITGSRDFHSGIDISGTGYGSRIYAVNNGTIEEKKYWGSYGYTILINHNNGYWTLYAHLSRFADIAIGDTVVAGQTIGYMGSTGASTGPHLHFEVRKGTLNNDINPWSIYD